jgi:hypothetical protein
VIVKCATCGTTDDRKRYWLNSDAGSNPLVCSECAPDRARRCDYPVSIMKDLIAGDIKCLELTLARLRERFEALE